MHTIRENITAIKSKLPVHVNLVAVSKTHSCDKIMEAYTAGQRIFGENRVLEMVDKFHQLPKDIKWHAIGHLQRNKVKLIAPFVDLIHAVDSERLLAEINHQAKQINRKINCLLQFHIAKEDSKYGLNKTEAENLIGNIQNYPNIEICGVMGMATFTENEQQIKTEFKTLFGLFNHFKNNYFASSCHFKEISMGMSGDYKLAIAEGSTLIRVGSSIFGSR